jgi:hypothetical protein
VPFSARSYCSFSRTLPAPASGTQPTRVECCREGKEQRAGGAGVYLKLSQARATSSLKYRSPKVRQHRWSGSVSRSQHFKVCQRCRSIGPTSATAMGRLRERRFSTAKTILPLPLRWKSSWPSGRTAAQPKCGQDEDSSIALRAREKNVPKARRIV